MTPTQIIFKAVVAPKPDWNVTELCIFLGVPHGADLYRIEGTVSVKLGKNDEITLRKGDKFFSNEVVG